MNTQSTTGNAAQDAYTYEGGPLADQGPPCDLLMAEFGIDYDGVAYGFRHCRYERLADAVAYARLLRSRPAQEGDECPPRRARTVAVPGDGDRALMASLGIAFEDGAFHFGGFRYELLADAVNYARSHQKGPS